LKLTNAEGDVVSVGFRPDSRANDLGAALIEVFGQLSGNAE
jgi:hypothetical protein